MKNTILKTKERFSTVNKDNNGMMSFLFGTTAVLLIVMLIIVMANSVINVSGAYSIKKQIKQQVSLFNGTISDTVFTDMRIGDFVSYEKSIKDKESELVNKFKQDFSSAVVVDGERQKISNISLVFTEINNEKVKYTFSCDIEIVSVFFGRERIKVDDVVIDCQHYFKDYDISQGGGDTGENVGNIGNSGGDD